MYFPSLQLRRARKDESPPLAAILPPEVFWIVIYFIIFSIFCPLNARLPPLKYFCPAMVCFLFAVLVLPEAIKFEFLKCSVVFLVYFSSFCVLLLLTNIIYIWFILEKPTNTIIFVCKFDVCGSGLFCLFNIHKFALKQVYKFYKL